MDHHKILGVPPDATLEEIKRVYKKHALRLHPDVNKKGAEAFMAVTDAYRALLKIKLGKKTSLSSGSGKEAHHDLSFVKGRISRSQVWAPDFHLLRKPRQSIENKPCDTCSGTGKLLNKPGFSIPCPACHGLGVKTQIVNI
jgi:DnaJ-class molecular chaperone